MTSFTGDYANALAVVTHKITCDRIGSREFTLYPPLFVHLVNHVYNVNLSYVFHCHIINHPQLFRLAIYHMYGVNKSCVKHHKRLFRETLTKQKGKPCTFNYPLNTVSRCPWHSGKLYSLRAQKTHLYLPELLPKLHIFVTVYT